MAAIVRGTDDAAARARLRKGLNTGDADLLATFDRLAEGHLQVYAGMRRLRCALLDLACDSYARQADYCSKRGRCRCAPGLALRRQA